MGKNNTSLIEHPSIDGDVLRIYERDVNRYKVLTKEQEIELGRRIRKGDKEARDLMINSNLRLVISIAKKYINYGIPKLDLIQEGNTGLFDAVDNYDPERGFKFSTYATNWIKKAIIRSVPYQMKAINLTEEAVNKANKWKAAVIILTEELGRKPNSHEIAEKLGLSEIVSKRVQKAVTVLDSVYIDQNLSSSHRTYQLEDSNSKTPLQVSINNEEEYMRKKILKEIRDLMREVLDSRERKILRLYYMKNLSNQKIGVSVGDLTKERIRQIRLEAEQKIREAYRDRPILHIIERRLKAPYPRKITPPRVDSPRFHGGKSDRYRRGA